MNQIRLIDEQLAYEKYSEDSRVWAMKHIYIRMQTRNIAMYVWDKIVKNKFN